MAKPKKKIFDRRIMKFKKITPAGHQDSPRAEIVLECLLDTDEMNEFGFTELKSRGIVDTDSPVPIEMDYGSAFHVLMRLPGDPNQTEVIEVSKLIDAKKCLAGQARLKDTKEGPMLAQTINVPLDDCMQFFRLMNILPIKVEITLTEGERPETVKGK